MFSNIDKGDNQSGRKYMCQATNSALLQSTAGSLHRIVVTSAGKFNPLHTGD